MNEAQYRQILGMVGVPATFEQTKPPQARVNITRVGIATTKSDDVLVNSYGVGVRTVTIAAADLPGLVPEKFDAVRIGNERLVFELVLPAHEPGTGRVIGYRCIVKGK